jgi:DNA-binding LacI/PurR family transcriptional regulator
LILLDKAVPGIPESIAVYQDFEKDIYDALASISERISKYSRITIVFPKGSHYPVEIVDGAQRFCDEAGKEFSVVTDLSTETDMAGTLFIALDDPELAKVVKAIRYSAYQLGNDVGVISFNETDLKELLDITVFTTDFEGMGSTAAGLILSKKSSQVRNPFTIIQRNSI